MAKRKISKLDKLVEDVNKIEEKIDLKDLLRDSINKSIGLADKIMSEDRSTVLRLKNVVGKLKDALKVIK